MTKGALRRPSCFSIHHVSPALFGHLVIGHWSFRNPVDSLWPTLVEFLLRLSAGLAAAMAIVPARFVSGGFFRVHLWVLMGLGTFASLAVYSRWTASAPGALPGWAFGCCLAAAIGSYLGAVVWMYDAQRLGKGVIVAVAGLFCGAAFASSPALLSRGAPLGVLVDLPTAAWLIGLFLTAMLLGHWYLNSPGMKLEPLKMLVALSGLAIVLRALVSGGNMITLASLGELPQTTIDWSFLAFRWLAGLILPAVMAWLTWQTLKVPNTQSATGILYAAVTVVFLGELTSQLLSRSLTVPL
jgi:hypothetical protein